MTQRLSNIVLTFCVVLSPSLFACSSPVDVGREKESTFSAGGLSDLDKGDPNSDPLGCGDLDRGQNKLNQLRLDYRSQDWDSLKGTSFSGQMDFGPKLDLRIDAEGKGEVTFGEGTVPPLPDDPESGYICELDDTQCGTTPVEGFPYRTVTAVLEEGRVRFTVLTAEPWDAWCEMQMPIEYEADECNFGIYDETKYRYEQTDGCVLLSDSGEDARSVDCGWVAAVPACACSGERCFVNPGFTASFDLTLSENGEGMTGTYAAWVNSEVATSRVELRRD